MSAKGNWERESTSTKNKEGEKLEARENEVKSAIEKSAKVQVQRGSARSAKAQAKRPKKSVPRALLTLFNFSFKN
jgi:hypothetical protein